MANFNKVILLGNLTRDPELRNTQGGTAVAKFGMATNRKFKDQEATCFVDLTAWGKQAEVIAEHVKKGDSLLIEGRLEYSQWESEGGKRSKLEVVVEQFQFVGGKQGAGRSPSRHEKKKADGYQSDDMDDLDNVPF